MARYTTGNPLVASASFLEIMDMFHLSYLQSCLFLVYDLPPDFFFTRVARQVPLRGAGCAYSFEIPELTPRF